MRAESNLTVIVVTYNSAHALPACLAAVQRHLPGCPVLVVDNCSTDESRSVALANGADKVLQQDRNAGFGRGVNQGVRESDTDLCLVLNPDAELTRVDEPATAALLGPGPVGLLGCWPADVRRLTSVVKLALPAEAELAWALTTWFLLPRGFPVTRPVAGPLRQRYVSGAAFVVARQEFLSTGGFDERLFLYFEDFDLARGYRALGLPVKATAAIRYAHGGGLSSPREEGKMKSFALLSLIEYQAKWRGRQAADRLGRRAVHALELIERLAGAVERTPRLGARARRKAVEARSVRSELARAVGGSTDFYPQAKSVLRQLDGVARSSRTDA